MSAPPRLVLLDAYRAFCALSVMLFHMTGTIAATHAFGPKTVLDAFGRCGDIGIYGFFVLSGFIMSYISPLGQAGQHRAITFIRGRACRIYPTYMVVFVLFFIKSWWDANQFNTTFMTWNNVASSLLLLPQDPAVVGGTGAPVVIVAWSLQYEMLFYALYALFLWSPWIGAAGAFALGISMSSFDGLDGVLSFLRPLYFMMFGSGIFIRHGVSNGWLPGCGKFLLTLGALATTTLIFFWWLAEQADGWAIGANPDFIATFAALGAIASVAGLALFERDERMPGMPFVVTLMSESSYALYLCHYPIIYILMQAGWLTTAYETSWSLGIILLTGATACIAVALLLHFGIERPALYLLKRKRFIVGFPMRWKAAA